MRVSIYYVDGKRVSSDVYWEHYNDPNNLKSLMIKYQTTSSDIVDRLEKLEERVTELERKYILDIEHLPLRCDDVGRPTEPWYQTDTTNIN